MCHLSWLWNSGQNLRVAYEVMEVQFSSLHVLSGSGEDLGLCSRRHFVGDAVGVYGARITIRSYLVSL